MNPAGFAPMDDGVSSAIADLETWMAVVDDALALPRDAAAFVHSLILATGARRGLEIGTSYGYSGLWMASALAQNGGSLITIDRESRKTEAARRAFESAGFSAVVNTVTGSAVDVLASLGGPFDVVLNDADKANCVRYVELLTGKLADRAIILTDNTRTHPAELAGYVTWIRSNRAFFSCDVPIGNGMELSVKLPCTGGAA